jgi:hypothetical protein
VAVLGDDDCVDLHVRDTQEAGSGLVDERAARFIVGGSCLPFGLLPTTRTRAVRPLRRRVRPQRRRQHSPRPAELVSRSASSPSSWPLARRAGVLLGQA